MHPPLVLPVLRVWVCQEPLGLPDYLCESHMQKGSQEDGASPRPPGVKGVPPAGWCIRRPVGAAATGCQLPAISDQRLATNWGATHTAPRACSPEHSAGSRIHFGERGGAGAHVRVGRGSPSLVQCGVRSWSMELGRSMRCSAELVNKAPSDSVIDRAKQRFVDNKHATKATLRQRPVK